jgi:hypothetical protein
MEGFNMFTVVYGGVWWCMAWIMQNCNSPPVRTCDICDLQTAEVVLCRKNHALCMDCFNKAMQVEIGFNRQRFVSSGCKLFCSLCMGPSTSRDRDPDFARKCASNLSDEVYALYESAVTEAAVIAAQQECESRFKSATRPPSQDPDKDSIGKMMLASLHHHTPPYTTMLSQLRQHYTSLTTWCIHGAHTAKIYCLILTHVLPCTVDAALIFAPGASVPTLANKPVMRMFSFVLSIFVLEKCILHHRTQFYGGASCMNGHAKESGSTLWLKLTQNYNSACTTCADRCTLALVS